MTTILYIDQPAKWSESLKSALSRVRPVMRAWEMDLPAKDAVNFECAISELSDALQDYSLRGWHCTRLTDNEIANIKANGLEVLSPKLIERRISDLIHQGML